MAEKHAVVRLDNMSGTKDGSLLKSVKVYKNDNPVAIDNAQLVVLGEREGREVYKAIAPTAESKPKDLVLIASEELFYDETRTHYLTEWVNEAGEICRGYVLHNGNIFTLTNREKDILALGMVLHFVEPYVYNTDALQNALNTKDFTLYSPANLLEKMTDLMNITRKRLKGEINLYSFRNGEISSLTE